MTDVKDFRIIQKALGLEKNDAEGGFYSSTYVSSVTLDGLKLPNMEDVDPARSLNSAIYYAITENSPSRMHQVLGDMIYHFYSGDSVEMLIIYPTQMAKKPEIVVLGNNVIAGEKSMLVIPGGAWVGSRVVEGGQYALMGVTMAPGFSPADYTIADADQLIMRYPDHKQFISSLNDRQSFYIFDIDHNVLFLPTKIRLFKTDEDNEAVEISQQEFDEIEDQIGREGTFKDYELRYCESNPEQHSFRYFNDLSEAECKAGIDEHLILDIEKAHTDGSYKGPSWDVLEYAIANNRPCAIITARGHSERVVRAGFQRLLDLKALKDLPNLLEVYCVNNQEMKSRLIKLADPDEGAERSAGRKRVATRIFVDNCTVNFGDVPKHKFGMSDDAPKNVYAVIQAMADCKEKYDHMRFYVINSHHGDHVKMEIVRLKP